MPAFPTLDGLSLNDLFAYLGSQDTGRGSTATPSLRGPVVASGGAPGGLEITVAQYGGMAGPPYPEGLEVPSERYYTDYGLNYPYVIAPPWSSIVAYDLNKGTIKWRQPLGDDEETIARGGKGTGLPRGGEPHGMVITSTGLIFVNARDKKIRAFDEEIGALLWTANLPAPTEGMPPMYEATGHQFLIIPAAATPAQDGREKRIVVAPGSRSYVAFALPQKAVSK